MQCHVDMNICKAPGLGVSSVQFLRLPQTFPWFLVFEQSDLDSPRKKNTNTRSKTSPQATFNHDVDRYCSIGRWENSTPIPA